MTAFLLFFAGWTLGAAGALFFNYALHANDPEDDDA